MSPSMVLPLPMTVSVPSVLAVMVTVELPDAARRSLVEVKRLRKTPVPPPLPMVAPIMRAAKLTRSP